MAAAHAVHPASMKLSATEMFSAAASRIMLFLRPNTIWHENRWRLLSRFEGTCLLNLHSEVKRSQMRGAVVSPAKAGWISRVPPLDIDRFREKILGDLTLVRGIGRGDGKETECPWLSLPFPISCHTPHFRVRARDVAGLHLRCKYSLRSWSASGAGTQNRTLPFSGLHVCTIRRILFSSTLKRLDCFHGPLSSSVLVL